MGLIPVAAGQLQQLTVNDFNPNFFVRTPFSITTTINLLIQQNDAVVVASPRVVTQSTKQATILIGTKFPIVFFDPRAGQFQVQYVDIGVKLQVKPVATDDGFVVMDIQPDISQFVALINNQFPETATRQANLSCRIKDGSTLVIGGLINETEVTTVTKIPFLGDIRSAWLVLQEHCQEPQQERSRHPRDPQGHGPTVSRPESKRACEANARSLFFFSSAADPNGAWHALLD